LPKQFIGALFQGVLNVVIPQEFWTTTFEDLQIAGVKKYLHDVDS